MHSTKLSVFDAHCDTLDLLRNGGDLNCRHFHLHLPAMRAYKKYIQVMAVWMDMESGEEPYAFAMAGIDRLRKNQDGVPLIKTAKDLQNHRKGPGFILSIEGGDAICGSLDKLHGLFSAGVRLMTLVWNGPNAISDSAMQESVPGGLTSFGKSVVSEMENLGMAVDVSHLSEKGFWDVIEIAKKPLIASHSCSKALCPHKRNLTDAQFSTLCKNGGVVGVNFYPEFLGGDKIDDIVRHILHFLELGGEEHIGLGSDFDGIPHLPEDIQGAADMYKILDALGKENLREETIQKIAYGNMEKYFLRVLP